jgi:hypothetical protein
MGLPSFCLPLNYSVEYCSFENVETDVRGIEKGEHLKELYSILRCPGCSFLNSRIASFVGCYCPQNFFVLVAGYPSYPLPTFVVNSQIVLQRAYVLSNCGSGVDQGKREKPKSPGDFGSPGFRINIPGFFHVGRPQKKSAGVLFLHSLKLEISWPEIPVYFMVWVSGRDNDKPSIAFREIVFKVNARIIGIIDEQKPSFWPVRKPMHSCLLVRLNIAQLGYVDIGLFRPFVSAGVDVKDSPKTFIMTRMLI